MTSNVEAAASAFPLVPWEACGITGKPFITNDLEDLVLLGRNDEYFAWERRPMGRSYYEGLLQFRLGHYWRYGFGVHALWSNGTMVGQAGLQVLDEIQDRVEFVVFLGNSYVGEGLGRCLATMLINRCSRAGMKDLYGVVRSDNPEGLRMINMIGASKLGFVVHFHQLAEIYQIDLRTAV